MIFSPFKGYILPKLIIQGSGELSKIFDKNSADTNRPQEHSYLRNIITSWPLLDYSYSICFW